MMWGFYVLVSVQHALKTNEVERTSARLQIFIYWSFKMTVALNCSLTPTDIIFISSNTMFSSHISFDIKGAILLWYLISCFCTSIKWESLSWYSLYLCEWIWKLKWSRNNCESSIRALTILNRWVILEIADFKEESH